MLSAKENYDRIMLQRAALHGQTEMLQKLCEWSTDNLSAEEVRELLLTKDKWKQMAFHFAAQHGKTEVLQKLWEWSTEKLSSEEVGNVS